MRGSGMECCYFADSLPQLPNPPAHRIRPAHLPIFTDPGPPMPDVPRTPPWMLPTPVPFSHEIRLLPLITRVSDGSRSRSGRGGGSHQSHLQTIVSPAATATSSLFSFGFTQRMTPSPGLGGNGGTSPTAYQDSLLPLLGRVLLSSTSPN